MKKEELGSPGEGGEHGPWNVEIYTHAFTSSPLKIGVERDGTVYELFVSTLARPSFTSSDVLDLSLHRGSFETVLADEDVEHFNHSTKIYCGGVQAATSL